MEHTISNAHNDIKVRLFAPLPLVMISFTKAVQENAMDGPRAKTFQNGINKAFSARVVNLKRRLQF